MRDIKFRAWDDQGCAMYLWDDMLTFGGIYFKNVLCGKDESMVVEQFTGLHDKNGKEIYEGDIYNDDGNIGVIKFGEFDFPGIPKLDGSTVSAGFYGQDSIQASFLGDIEIIGNIHENPELLEGLV